MEFHKCIKVFDQVAELLREADMEDLSIDLPQIVVIGAQSSGKSSLLENLVGHSFLPQGGNMQTKCPAEIRLRKDTSVKEDVNGLAYDITIFHESPRSVTKKFTSFEMIANEIRERQADLLRLVDSQPGNNRFRDNVSTKRIIIEIKSPNYLPLTLVDLPGFISNPLPQQDPEIRENIKDLVRGFAKNDRTIVLAVHEATQDIANCVAIDFMKEFDPTFQRTVLVLTKPDLLPADTVDVNPDTSPIQRVKHILQKQNMQTMKHDVYMVRNRLPSQVQLAIPQLRKAEDEYFTKSPFSTFRSHMGLGNLSKLLSKLLEVEVRKVVPDLKKQIFNTYAEVQSDLNQAKTKIPEKVLDWSGVLINFTMKLKDIPRGLLADYHQTEMHKLVNTYAIKEILTDEMEKEMQAAFVKYVNRQISDEKTFTEASSRAQSLNVDISSIEILSVQIIRNIIKDVSKWFERYLAEFEVVWAYEIRYFVENNLKEYKHLEPIVQNLLAKRLAEKGMETKKLVTRIWNKERAVVNYDQMLKLLVPMESRIKPPTEQNRTVGADRQTLTDYNQKNTKAKFSMRKFRKSGKLTNAQQQENESDPLENSKGNYNNKSIDAAVGNDLGNPSTKREKYGKDKKGDTTTMSPEQSEGQAAGIPGDQLLEQGRGNSLTALTPPAWARNNKLVMAVFAMVLNYVGVLWKLMAVELRKHINFIMITEFLDESAENMISDVGTTADELGLNKEELGYNIETVEVMRKYKELGEKSDKLDVIKSRARGLETETTHVGQVRPEKMFTADDDSGNSTPPEQPSPTIEEQKRFQPAAPKVIGVDAPGDSRLLEIFDSPPHAANGNTPFDK